MEFENPFNDTVKFVFGVIEMMFDDSMAVFCKSFLGMMAHWTNPIQALLDIFIASVGR